MFDCVTLKMYNLPKDYTLSEKVKIEYRSDTNTYKGKIKNMTVYKNLNCLAICGSLAKYLHGENITPLSRKEVKLSIEKLGQDMNFDLKNAIVSSVEFGTSIITKEKPFEYMNLFGHTKKLTRIEYSKWAGVESVTYTSETGSFEFTGYDKIKEMLDKKQEIPSLFAGSNVLRLEYRIRRRKGIKAKFKGDLTAYSLFDKTVYQQFLKLFLDFYMSIEKMGQLVFVDKSKKTTPLRVQKLGYEQFRQLFPKDSRYFIQQLKEAGKLSRKDIERLRAENHKLENDIYVLEQGVLIQELNALVDERVMFGT